MKNLLTIPVIILSHLVCFAQGVAINETFNPAASSAILDVSSTTKGMLVPRMSGAQRIMIVAPAQGLLVYDTDSRSFWFYDSGWSEISGGGVMTGPASGDLSGNYPSPTVSKIQNLDVAFGVPLDKQVLKWDALSNNWKGRNDSLFLPYQAVFSDPVTLFGITNTNTGLSAAIIGKKTNAGSGFALPGSAGVWGDNSSGLGIVGTSNMNAGILGISAQYHGIEGQSDKPSHAGLYGTNTSGYGFGVKGLIENDGAAIYGLNSGDGGQAALFKTSSWDHSDTTMITSTNGIGLLSSFRIPNTVSTSPAVDISHAGNGMGMKVRLTNANASSNAVDIYHQGGGIGLYSKTHNGVAGKFEITNPASSYPAVMVHNGGFGTSLYVNSLQTGLTGPAIDVFSLGEGGGINVYTNKGKAGVFATGDANATAETMNVSTVGKGNIAKFTKNNVNGSPNDPAVLIDNTSLGNALKINSPHGATSKSALEISYGGSFAGAYISSSSDGLRSSSLSGDSRGIYASNFFGGIALEAISTSLTANKPTINAINTVGGTGVSCTVYGGEGGTAIRGNVNGSEGIGVWGAVSGSGTGVYATSFSGEALSAQTSGQGRAGLFQAFDSQNPNEAVTIEQNGLGTALLVSSLSGVSGQPAMTVKSNNNAPFATFETGGGSEKLIIEKTGNVITDGTITVKENKGIVRNTYSGQLRIETVEAFYDPPGQSINFAPMGSVWIDVPFNTAFAAPPVVYVGNYIGDSNSNGDELNPVVMDVTSTGLTLKIQNLTANNITVASHSWKLTAIGVE